MQSERGQREAMCKMDNLITFSFWFFLALSIVDLSTQIFLKVHDHEREETQQIIPHLP